MKKLLVRRLIGGLLLAIFGIYNLYSGIHTAVIGVRYQLDSITSFGGDFIILGGVSSLVGIIFASTSYTFPKKWLDYTLTIIETLGIVICMTEFSLTDHNNLVWIPIFIAAVLLIVSLPWSKKGYKEMPYGMQVPVKKYNVEKDPSKNLDQIAKLKQLLDTDAITQEEFDEKKKELLDRF